MQKTYDITTRGGHTLRVYPTSGELIRRSPRKPLVRSYLVEVITPAGVMVGSERMTHHDIVGLRSA